MSKRVTFSISSQMYLLPPEKSPEEAAKKQWYTRQEIDAIIREWINEEQGARPVYDAKPHCTRGATRSRSPDKKNDVLDSNVGNDTTNPYVSEDKTAGPDQVEYLRGRAEAC